MEQSIEQMKDIARRVALEIIDFEEFTLFIDEDEGMYRLQDNQGANLGDIESDTFYTLGAVIDRMQIYHQDYFYEDATECIAEAGECDDYSWKVVLSRLLKSSTFYELLDDKPCEDYLLGESTSPEDIEVIADYLYASEPDLKQLREFNI